MTISVTCLTLLPPAFWTGFFLEALAGLLLYSCRFKTEITAYPKHVFVDSLDYCPNSDFVRFISNERCASQGIQNYIKGNCFLNH